MTAFTDLPEFQRGSEFELALSARLQRGGLGVLAVYDANGGKDKAPIWESTAGDRVAPDLLVANEGHTFWVEAKRKTRTDLYRRTQTVETGLQLRHYFDYCAIRDDSGLPVWLVFGHERENEVRVCKLGTIEPRIYTGDKMGRGGMAFFPWAKLRLLCRFDEVIPGARAA